MATASKPGVGKRVKQARLKADLSQRELAAQAGVTGSYVSLVEAGQRVPTLDVLREFAGPLGVAAAWLETGYVNGKVTSGQQRSLEQALHAVDQAQLVLRDARKGLAAVLGG